MKQLVLSLGVRMDVRNMVFMIILTICIIFYSGAPISAQQSKIDCANPPCPEQKQTSGCMQNAKFTTLYPVSPTQNYKDYHEERYVTPDNRQTSADSPDCIISSSGPRRFCLRTFTTHHVRMSRACYEL